MALGFTEAGYSFLTLDSENSTMMNGFLNLPGRDALPQFTVGLFYKARAWETGEGQFSGVDKVSRKLQAWPTFLSNGYVNHPLMEMAPQVVSSISTSGDTDYFRTTWYSGTFHFSDIHFETKESLGGTPVKDKWLFIGATADINTGTLTQYIIDPDDGTTIAADTISNGLLISDPTFDKVDNDIAGNNLIFATDASHPNGSPVHTDWTMQVAEYDIWLDVKTESELQAFAQVGFADINLNTNLALSWNFMRNWEAISGSKYQVLCATGDNNTGNFRGNLDPSRFTYTLDNPVPVFLLRTTASEHDYTGFGIFSAATGTAKISVYPSGTPTPSKADIFNGVNAIAQATLQPDGVTEALTNIGGLTTSTDYVAYAVQDEYDVGTYGTISTSTFTTPTKYSEIITDVTGASVGAQTGIQWAWFDSVDPDALGSPSAQGTAEVTDGTGLLEITLPTSISTAKGSQGTMVLRSDWDSEIQSASHIVAVK